MFSIFRPAGIDERLRALHSEIQQLAMADDSLAEIWAPLNPPGSSAQQRQHMYVNLIVTQWELEFEYGRLNAVHLRNIAEAVFSTDPGRRYWPVAYPLRLTEATSKRRRRFLTILDEAYAAAGPGTEAGMPEPVPSPA